MVFIKAEVDKHSEAAVHYWFNVLDIGPKLLCNGSLLFFFSWSSPATAAADVLWFLFWSTKGWWILSYPAAATFWLYLINVGGGYIIGRAFLFLESKKICYLWSLKIFFSNFFVFSFKTTFCKYVSLYTNFVGYISTKELHDIMNTGFEPLIIGISLMNPVLSKI